MDREGKDEDDDDFEREKAAVDAAVVWQVEQEVKAVKRGQGALGNRDIVAGRKQQHDGQVADNQRQQNDMSFAYSCFHDGMRMAALYSRNTQTTKLRVC